MWSALENIALRKNLPAPLKAGSSIHGILVSGQLEKGRHNLHYLGRRRSNPYLLKQFYSLNTDAFLRWQNEARFISFGRQTDLNWPCEEWRGGLIAPFTDALPVNMWLQEVSHSLEKSLHVIAMIASQIARLHSSGITHRNLSPASVHIKKSTVILSDFGCAQYGEWDDFWEDSALIPDDTTCVSPELLCGKNYAQDEDIHAFGILAHLILSGRPAFSPIKQTLRTLFPRCIPPNKLAVDHAPPSVREIIATSLSPTPENRPRMESIAKTLAGFGANNMALNKPGDLLNKNTSDAEKKKVMVFIKGDSRSIPIIDAVIQSATATPSRFLFVGLIPNNLPSGHNEHFKGKLFRKLGQGLMRCRAEGVSWSLRVFENIDAEMTAMELVRQYQPDQIILGKPEKPHRHSFARHSLPARLQLEGIPMTLVD